MRPAQSMYVTREEWQSDLIVWMSEDPTFENQKEFLVFTKVVGLESFVFEGTLSEFSEQMVAVKSWEEVVAWAASEGKILLVEDTEEYDEAVEFLELAEVGEDDT